MNILSRAAARPAASRPQRLVIAADSVAADRSDANEVLSGWGQHLGDLVGGTTDVFNRAGDSCTTHWFFRNRLASALEKLAEEDLFLIGFGVCEQAMTRPDLYLTPEEFRAYLCMYVDVLRERGIVPVLVTQVARHVFGPDGTLAAVAGDYSAHTRQVAAERGVAPLNLQRMSADLFARQGAEYARGYFRWFDVGQHPGCPDGIIDTLHLNRRGARAVAQLAADGLHALGLLPAAPRQAVRPLTGPRPPVLSTEQCRQQWRTWSRTPSGHPAPEVVTPVQGVVGHPSLRFTGLAARGSSYVLSLRDDQVLGAAGVGPDGSWKWHHLVNWAAGKHGVTVAALSAQGCSAPARVAFAVRAKVPPASSFPTRGPSTGLLRCSGERPGPESTPWPRSARGAGSDMPNWPTRSGGSAYRTTGCLDITPSPSSPTAAAASRNRPACPSRSWPFRRTIGCGGRLGSGSPARRAATAATSSARSHGA